MCDHTHHGDASNVNPTTFLQRDDKLDREMRTGGLLRIYTDVLEEQNKTLFLIKDGTVFDSIFSKDNNEPAFSHQSISIWSYFPEYYIVIFEAFALDKDGFYKVLYNNDTLLVAQMNNVTVFETWEEHIKKAYILTSNSNPLKVKPDKNSESFEYDYQELSFEVIEIKEQWVKVKCNIDCEGCPGIEITGWIQWRENNMLKVELRYVC